MAEPVYFSPLTVEERAAKAADRILREVPNYRENEEVKRDVPRLERALEVHVKPNMKFIEKYAAKNGINPKLLMAIIAVEQRGTDKAGEYKTSSQKAEGLMQITPVVKRDYKINTASPEDSIRGAAEFLRDMQGKFGNDFAVLGAVYHGGETNVRMFDQQQRGLGSVTSNYAGMMDILNDKLRSGEEVVEFLDTTNPTARLQQTLPQTPPPKRAKTFEEAVSILKAKP